MKYFNIAFLAFSTFFLTLTASARAQNTETQSPSTYGELSALTSQIAILKAQAAIANLKQQIAQTKRTTLDSAGQGDVPPSATAGQIDNPAPTDENANLPRILSISGEGKRLSALLLTPEGGEVEVKPGTPLGNGIIVQSLLTDAVYITKNGYFIALPFARSGVSNSPYAPGG